MNSVNDNTTPICTKELKSGLVSVAIWEDRDHDDLLHGAEVFYDFSQPLKLFGGSSAWVKNLNANQENGFFLLRKPRRPH